MLTNFIRNNTIHQRRSIRTQLNLKIHRHFVLICFQVKRTTSRNWNHVRTRYNIYNLIIYNLDNRSQLKQTFFHWSIFPLPKCQRHYLSQRSWEQIRPYITETLILNLFISVPLITPWEHFSCAGHMTLPLRCAGSERSRARGEYNQCPGVWIPLEGLT